MRARYLIFFFVLLLMPALLFAAGKVTGTVLDKENGEPLVGANVSIEGTTYGAATDVSGEYTILNVPAGLYTLKTTYVGYGPVSFSNVRVNNDLTTSLSFSLSTEAVTLQGVEIVAQRPLVNKSATNAVRIVTGDDIANMPVRGVNNILAVSPGVVLQDNTVFVRGGRQDEVGFYLEGVSITNPMVGGRAVTLVQDALEELSIQAGGYNAEFGGANSGIIQQTLKSGTTDWKASAQYQTDNFAFKGKSKRFDGKKNLGTYSFGYNEFTGTLSGPIVDERFKFFGLFNYLFNRDNNPQPYPGINLGWISDPVSGDSVNLLYPAGPVLDNSRMEYTGTGTFTFDFKPVTVRLAGTYTRQTYYNPFSSTRNPGNIQNFLNTGRNEEHKNNNGSGSAKFTYLVNPTSFLEVTGGYFFQNEDWGDPFLKDNFYNYGDSVTNAQAGIVWTRTATETKGRYVPPRVLQIFTFAFNQPGDIVAGYGKFRRSNISFSGAYIAQLGKEHSVKVGGEFARYTMRNYSLGNEAVRGLAAIIDQNSKLAATDPTKQTLEQIMIRRGVNNFGYDPLGNLTDVTGINEPKHPVFGAGYIQDKIEYSDLVINVGFRYDYINSDSRVFMDPSRPELSIDKNTNLVVDPSKIDVLLPKVAKFQAISPRLGLSFPVTDRTVFHTQFGKFVQQSRLRDIYVGLYSTGNSMAGGFFIGSPVGFNLRPERTTQYEIGFTQQISDFASFDITGYYKDIKDQIVYDQQATATGSPYGAYAYLRNGDFATTKGIEVTFNMRRQKRIQFNSSLSFNDARGTGSFPYSSRGIVAAPLDGVTIYRPAYVTPLEFNNAVRGSVNLDYRYGRNDGGPVLENLGASVLLTFNSGHPFTRGKGGADLEGDARDRIPVGPLNSSTTPWVFQVDLKIDKSFNIGDMLNANVFVYVINLFDTKNVTNVFLRTGSTTDDGYLSDPALGGKLIETFGQQYEAMYKAVSIDYYQTYQGAPFLLTAPYFYGPPRQIRLGVRLEY